MGTSSSREKSRRLYNLRKQYFAFLRGTGCHVDPYVRAFLESHFALFPEARSVFLLRYRFGVPQLRPALVRLAYELVGGADWLDIVPFCGAIEVKETAYYCLDDVIDREADSRLILQGVGLYSISYQMVCEASRRLSPSCFQSVLEEMLQLDENTLQGAMIDSQMHGTDEACYMRKVEGYNFWEQALKIGGILGNAACPIVDLLGRIGKRIGMAHIIANDCWDFGKDLEDFRQRKSTRPIMFAHEHVSEKDRGTLESLFGRSSLSEEEIKTVRRIVVQSGAIADGRAKALALCEDAIQLLQQFPESPARQLLEFSTTYTQKNRYFSVLEEYE